MGVPQHVDDVCMCVCVCLCGTHQHTRWGAGDCLAPTQGGFSRHDALRRGGSEAKREKEHVGEQHNNNGCAAPRQLSSFIMQRQRSSQAVCSYREIRASRGGARANAVPKQTPADRSPWWLVVSAAASTGTNTHIKQCPGIATQCVCVPRAHCSVLLPTRTRHKHMPLESLWAYVRGASLASLLGAASRVLVRLSRTHVGLHSQQQSAREKSHTH